jgi:ABC-type nitrate/sulfonate/bicarbonate transport system substrate-binding protein
MRDWIARIVLSVALAAAGVSTAPAQGANGPPLLNWGTISITAANWPYYVAQAKGIYAKHNLKVERSIISAQTITSAVIGGSIQIGFLGATQMIAADDVGANLVAVGQGMDPAPYFLIGVPSVKTLADLKGKTLVMSNPGDVYTEVVKVILRKAGLDPEKDVNFTFGPGSNQRVAALTNQAVQAGLLVPPEDLPLVEKGYHRLAFTPDYFPHLALSLMAVQRDWAQKNAGLLRGFLQARADAIQWLYDPTNKKEALKILLDATHSTESSVEESYDIFITKMRLFPKNGCIQTEGLAKTQEMLHQLKALKNPPQPMTKLASMEWCPK